MNVSVIISTYGSEEWRNLAQSRAYPSALDQGAHEIVVGHDPEGTLASVRNALARKAEGEWICFLDGDDELAPGYLGAMKRAYEQEGREDGTPLLLTPAAHWITVRGRPETPPKFFDECLFENGNWMVIGTLVPRDLFFQVGGFEEWQVYEDWALWARCWKAGAVPVRVPDAVYRAHRKRGLTRNHALRHRERDRVYWEIKAAVFG